MDKPRKIVKSSGYGRPSSGYSKPSSGYSRPSSGYGRPKSSGSGKPMSSKTGAIKKTTIKEAQKDKEEEAIQEEAKPKGVKVPALTVLPKPRRENAWVLERLKKKAIRRYAPGEEDIKKIKEIIKSLTAQVVSVQEFVGLVSPYTGDGGNALRTVMANDLSNFRRLAKQVYDQMTQDVSDVLANEQIQLTEYFRDRYNGFRFKMTRLLDQIHDYIPKFNFDHYFKDKQAYLEKHFPLPQESGLDAEAEELERRQLIYQRLLWLRSEGVRLTDENKQLQNRLKQLKQQQHEELIKSKKQEEMIEERKTVLESTEAQLQEELKELSESIHEKLVSTEEAIRINTDKNAVKESISKKQLRSKMGAKRTSRAKETWNVKVAKKIETKALEETASEAVSQVSTSVAQGAKKKQIRPKVKKPARDRSPFHFSPIKSPPKPQERERSPFHYSPPKSPVSSPFHYSPPRPQSQAPTQSMSAVEVESSTTVVDNAAASQAKPIPRFRRGLAPRDTWGGF